MFQHRRLRNCLAVTGVVAAALMATETRTEELTAQTTAIVLQVTHQTVPGGEWKRSKVGTRLPSGSRVRTARRSKCEIQFPGGALVRMAPLSEMVLSSVSDRRVKLVSGQVLANVVRGQGARIEGATATATIRGTWVLYDGENLSAWDGEASLDTPAGSTKVGDQQKASMKSTSVRLRTEEDADAGTVNVAIEGENLHATYEATGEWVLVATYLYVGTEPPTVTTPHLFPYKHEDLGGATTDDYLVPVAELEMSPKDTLYIAACALLRRPTGEYGEDGKPIYEERIGWGEGMEFGGVPAMYFPFKPTVISDNYPWSFPTGTPRPWWHGLKSGTNTQATPGTSAGLERQEQWSAVISPIAEGGVPSPTSGRGKVHVVVQQGGTQAPVALASLSGWHLVTAAAGVAAFASESEELLGRRFFGPSSDVDAYTLVTEGMHFAGVRLRLSGVSGETYGRVGWRTSHEFEGDLDVELDEAFLLVRTARGDATLGRQRVLEGPVNNSNLGRLVGLGLVDGVRWRLAIDDFTDVDLMWMEDFTPLDERDGSGWYVRAQRAVGGGQVGVNWLRQGGAGTGLTCDVTWPAVPGKLDTYAEFGDDPRGAHLDTVGVYLPALYQSSGLDVFVERSRRRGYPSVASLLAYKDFDEDLNALGLVRRIAGGDWEFGLGIIKRFGYVPR